MARPTKQGIDYFPIWKPNWHTETTIYNNSIRAYKTLRNSSNGFISKKKVREMIFIKCNHKCVDCGSIENLQIDHIISVYHASKDKKFIATLNTYDNLQVLCAKCNATKTPDIKEKL